MFNLGFIPLRALPYVIAGAGVVLGTVTTLLVEHQLLPRLKKSEGDEKTVTAS